jgi:type 1 fimbria pilin
LPEGQKVWHAGCYIESETKQTLQNKIRRREEEIKMKNLRNLMAAITLLAVLVLSTTSANAGILMSDFAGSNNPDPCSVKDDSKLDSGILMSDITGIIIAGFTGIIIAGRNGETSHVDCGILMSD